MKKRKKNGGGQKQRHDVTWYAEHMEQWNMWKNDEWLGSISNCISIPSHFWNTYRYQLFFKAYPPNINITN